MVHRFGSSQTNRRARLVHLARRQGPEPATEQLDLHFRRLGLAVRPQDEPVLLPLFLSAAARPELAQSRSGDAMFNSTIFWYKRGVAGFRLDAVDTLFEDPNLTDNPTLPGKNEYGDPNQENASTTTSCPKCTTCCKGCARQRRIQRSADRRNLDDDVSELKDYYGTQHDELQMPMDLMFTKFTHLSPPEFPQTRRSCECFRRMAGIGDEQSRYRASLHALRRRQT